MHKLKAMLISAVVGAAYLAGCKPVEAVNAPLRILCVGDSISVGYTDVPNWTVPYQFGYRSGLYNRLAASAQAGGRAFQFVGSSQEPFNAPYNGLFGLPTIVGTPDLRLVGQDHSEAYGGQKTAGVDAGIVGWLAAAKPDVVLLMIGINDIPKGAPTTPDATAATASALQTAETNLNSIVAKIVANAPDARVIVAQITPYTVFTPAIVEYNTYIRNTLLPLFQAQGKQVSTVDQYANFAGANATTINAQLYPTGMFNHPNAVGYERMARTWFKAIASLGLGVTGASPSNLVKDGGFETPKEALNSHMVQPGGSSWKWTKSTAGSGSGIDRGDFYGAGNFTPFEGAQQAFLQSAGDGSVGSISQTVSGFDVTKKYRLSFHARAMPVLPADPFTVKLSEGSQAVALFKGADIAPVASDYLGYSSELFSPLGATMTLQFEGTGSTTASGSWIDGVSITEAAPEPIIPQPVVHAISDANLFSAKATAASSSNVNGNFVSSNAVDATKAAFVFNDDANAVTGKMLLSISGFNSAVGDVAIYDWGAGSGGRGSAGIRVYASATDHSADGAPLNAIPADYQALGYFSLPGTASDAGNGTHNYRYQTPDASDSGFNYDIIHVNAAAGTRSLLFSFHSSYAAAGYKALGPAISEVQGFAPTAP